MQNKRTKSDSKTRPVGSEIPTIPVGQNRPVSGSPPVQKPYRPEPYGIWSLAGYILAYRKNAGPASIALFPLAAYGFGVIIWYAFILPFGRINGVNLSWLSPVLHASGITLNIFSLLAYRRNRNRLLVWLGFIRPFRKKGYLPYKDGPMLNLSRTVWYFVTSVCVGYFLWAPVIQTDPVWFGCLDVQVKIAGCFCFFLLLDRLWIFRKTRIPLVLGISVLLVTISAVVAAMVKTANLWIF